MARGLNKVMLIGNMGRDPEMRHTTNGGEVANLAIATSESWRDKETGEQMEKTEWHRVVAFGKLAEIIGQYLHKGSKVYIEGSLQTRKWQDKDGNDRYTTEIKARDMQMLDGNRREGDAQPPGATNGAEGTRRAPKPGEAGYSGSQEVERYKEVAGGGGDLDDDIPF